MVHDDQPGQGHKQEVDVNTYDPSDYITYVHPTPEPDPHGALAASTGTHDRLPGGRANTSVRRSARRRPGRVIRGARALR